ncbi:MAG: glycosyltransferase [Clostridia bacterium]|nr:glycosyltransferase [Clostridia bacterium]
MKKYLVLNFNSKVFLPIAHNIESLGYQVKEFSLEYNNDKDGNVQKIEKIIKQYKPDVILSYGWWDENIDIENYEQIVKSENCIHVFWAFDDPTYMDHITIPMAKFSHYIFTTDGDCIQTYKAKGVNAYFLPCACDPSIHTKTIPLKQYTNDIVLLANNYNWKQYVPFPNRINGIQHVLIPLIENNYDIKVYGLWWLDEDRHFVLDSKYYGGVIDSTEIADVYSSCKMAIGFLSIGISRTMLSMRVFEALGSGICYLTQYSPALETFFTNKKHLLWSKSKEETLESVKYYLHHKDEREKIARSGQEFVYSRHTYLHRAYQITKIIENKPIKFYINELI